MAFLQYPWRFILMAVFFASFISGALFWLIEDYLEQKLIVILGLVVLSCLLILVSAKFFIPEKYLQIDSNYYTNASMLLWKTSKTSDEYMPKNFQRPNNIDDVANFANLNTPDVTISNVNLTPQVVMLNVQTAKAQNIIIPIAYFPAWQGYVDGGKIAIANNQGRIAISLSKGQHQLKLEFKQTKIESLGDFLSLAGILALFAGIIQLKKKYE
jgi:uncharacterized membrane protein YfhO